VLVYVCMHNICIIYASISVWKFVCVYAMHLCTHCVFVYAACIHVLMHIVHVYIDSDSCMDSATCFHIYMHAGACALGEQLYKKI